MIHKQELLRLPTLAPQNETDQVRYSQAIQRTLDNRLSNIPWTARLTEPAGSISSGSYLSWGPRLYIVKEHSWTQLTIDYTFSSYTDVAATGFFVTISLNSLAPADTSADFIQSTTGAEMGYFHLNVAYQHQTMSLSTGPISMHGNTSDAPLTAGRYSINPYIKRIYNTGALACGATTNHFFLRAYEHAPMPDVSYSG